MQRFQSTSLSECATKVQNLDHTYQKQRETKESLRDSRSSSFDQRPVRHTERNERLELLEKLERGPVQFHPPIDDPNFERLEPNSHTKLRYVFLLMSERGICPMCAYRIIWIVDTRCHPVYCILSLDGLDHQQNIPVIPLNQ